MRVVPFAPRPESGASNKETILDSLKELTLAIENGEIEPEALLVISCKPDKASSPMLIGKDMLGVQAIGYMQRALFNMCQGEYA
ncbi:MAG: hypothetical protein ACOH2T_19220 [Pseudomonas sp.]